MGCLMLQDETKAGPTTHCPACCASGAAPDVLVAALGLAIVFGLAQFRALLCESHSSALELTIKHARHPSPHPGAQPRNRHERRAQDRVRKGIILL